MRLAILILATGLVASPATALQDDRDAQYAAALEQGERAIDLRQFGDALDAYRRANGLRNKRSAEALFGMARAYRGLEAPKKAADACTDALKYVGANAELEADIRNVRGSVMVELVEKNDDERLKDAEADFRAVTTLTDRLPIAHFSLGSVLLRQGRDDEGVAALTAFIEKAPYGKEAVEARRMIGNPRLARVTFAPSFSITTPQGERIALEDLRGRVVLLDFWATWCAPCVAATPGLQRLAKKYAGQPFTLVGISLDHDTEAWRRYIEKHRMDWPQYLDDGRVAGLFNVKPIPTYIVVDYEGVVRGVKTGYGSGTNRWLDGEIRRCLEELQKAGGRAPEGGR
jgi:thiol-disulfide isomerase/thioredoxin